MRLVNPSERGLRRPRTPDRTLDMQWHVRKAELYVANVKVALIRTRCRRDSHHVVA